MPKLTKEEEGKAQELASQLRVSARATEIAGGCECDGTGRMKCPSCNGTGEERPHYTGHASVDCMMDHRTRTCYRCDGEGRIDCPYPHSKKPS